MEVLDEATSEVDGAEEEGGDVGRSDERRESAESLLVTMDMDDRSSVSRVSSVRSTMSTTSKQNVRAAPLLRAYS